MEKEAMGPYDRPFYGDASSHAAQSYPGAYVTHTGGSSPYTSGGHPGYSAVASNGTAGYYGTYGYVSAPPADESPYDIARRLWNRLGRDRDAVRSIIERVVTEDSTIAAGGAYRDPREATVWYGSPAGFANPPISGGQGSAAGVAAGVPPIEKANLSPKLRSNESGVPPTVALSVSAAAASDGTVEEVKGALAVEGNRANKRKTESPTNIPNAVEGGVDSDGEPSAKRKRTESSLQELVDAASMVADKPKEKEPLKEPSCESSPSREAQSLSQSQRQQQQQQQQLQLQQQQQQQQQQHQQQQQQHQQQQQQH
eukprot:Opistho-2@89451